MTETLIAGAEPWTCVATDTSAAGALVLHGFTGNPGSMRELAEAFAAAGFHVEMPRLPGHGTTVDDMLTTSWSDWAGEAEAAYRRLRQRASTVFVVGLSMGGSLALRVGVDHPEVAGLICVNPATTPQPPEVVAMLEAMIADGTAVMPGIGSDIAQPGVVETAYPGTPVAPLVSFITEGLAPLEPCYAQMSMPLLLLSSPQDHVIEPVQSDHLAETYGGLVERVSLDRSYHVATMDYDKGLILERSIEFAQRVVTQRSA